jgi:hypothetical protein
MQKKLLAIGVIFLFWASVLPMACSQQYASEPQTSQTRDLLWSDNFDSYANGSGLHGQGGWFGWGDNPAADAKITDVKSRSSPHSVEIKEASDMVHTWVGINTNNCTFTTYVYIPGDFVGQSYLILMSLYSGDSSKWATQLRFDSDIQRVASEYEDNQLPLITDQWVELRVVINFTLDNQKVYYGGELLTEKNWTSGVSGGGPLQLGGIDLFANGASPVYYDDLSIIGTPLPPVSDLKIDSIKGGFGVSAIIKNIGDGDATNVAWNITLDGKLVFVGKEKIGSLTNLAAANNATIKTGFIFGIGKTNIVVKAICDEGATAEKTATGFVLGPFVLGVK